MEFKPWQKGILLIFKSLSMRNLDRKAEIVAVIDKTFAVVKRKPEKNQACTGFEPYDLCNTGAAL